MNPLENYRFIRVVQTLMVLILCALVYLSQTQAGFYCEKYCEASGLKFQQYTPGSCRCGGQYLPEYLANLNVSALDRATSEKVGTTFKNLSQVQPPL